MTDSTISHYPAERLNARRRPGDTRAIFPAARPRMRVRDDFSQYRTNPGATLASLAISLAIVVAVGFGWLNRDDSGLTPRSGTGYWLGIAGSVLMLLLLLYPLRKRIRSLRVIGTVRFWFRAHMILGVCGSLLILWHANFRLGSINSNVALAAMLVVATSGLCGRYLYGKIHLGLHGRKAVARDLIADAQALKGFIGADLPPLADHVVAQLETFERVGTSAPNGVLAQLAFLPVVSWRGTILRRRLIAEARQAITIEGKRLGRSQWVRRQQLSGIADIVTLHVAAVKKAAVFALYERLFAIWHLFHVPLFLILVIAASIHIFAALFF